MGERVTTRLGPEQVRMELIQSVIDCVEHALVRRGIESSAAHETGVSVADTLADHLGGQVIQFPTEARRKLELRDAAILARFTGDNVTELAHELHMTVRGMRKLLQRARTRQKANAPASVYDPHARAAQWPFPNSKPPQ